MNVIRKKISSEYYKDVYMQKKNFELRKDEDNAQPGDLLVLKEWDEECKCYTGNQVQRQVKYVLRNAQEFGLQDGYCIIGW